MSDSFPACAVVSLPDVELEAQISCARRRLIAIAPGFTESVARVIAHKWHDLGPDAVQVVLDPDPEVCRLGLADMTALELLAQTASEIGATLHKQRGLRVGLVITDETTTVYSPVARLVEAGGLPGEKLNALRLDAPVAQCADGNGAVENLDLHPESIDAGDMESASKDLANNPPIKFDLARKVRVFNARFEFVEFKLEGLHLERKRVKIGADLLGLAKDPKTQKLLHTTFQLIEEGGEISSSRVTKLKDTIVKDFLILLPGYGTVILRSNKEAFQRAVQTLEREIESFQCELKEKLHATIAANRDALAADLELGVVKNPPRRWLRYIGEHPQPEQVKSMLRDELANAFGNVDDLFRGMSVKVLFKGVTYESLNDPEFIGVASKKIPFLTELHEEFDAAKAAELENLVEKN